MNIVFVHLNTTLPRYLRSNIEAHVERFPNHRITVIHNSEVKIPKIRGLDSYLYRPGENWERLESLYLHEKKFRGNFWLTSTTRLCALEEYLSYSGEDLVHLESDVVISNDFPFARLGEIEEDIAFPIISEPRGVASVMYLREIAILQKLNKFVILEAEKDAKTTEMLILRKFYDLYPEEVRVLPIGPKERSSYRQLPDNLWTEMQKSHELLGGCFDGVDIGQFYFGTDPRNRRGKILLREDLVQGYANIRDWTLSFSSDRNFPEIAVSSSRVTCKLYSLHLPSKKNALFSSRHQANLFRIAIEESRRPSTTVFSFGTFVSAVVIAISSRVSRLREKTRIKLSDLFGKC